MWGNTLGWCISALLVIGTILGLRFAQQYDRETAPTEFSSNIETFAQLDFPVPLLSIIPELQGTETNAPLVRKAIDAYLADRVTYDRAAAGNIPKDFDSLPGVAAIVDVAMSRNRSLLAPLADQVVTFRAVKPELEAMRSLGEGLVRAALYREESDPATAIGYYNAALALGAKMYHERLVYAEASAGLSLMTEASLRLAKKSRDPQRATALAAFEPARRDMVAQRITPVWRVVGSVDPGIVAKHTGDLFVIARNAKERMWRVEAVLAIGRYRFSAQRQRDRAKAERFLEELATTENDPIVRRAAIAAREMTVQDFRMLR